jgi:TolB-like protein
MSLFEELKRRNVFRVGVAYVVGAWLLLQLTEVLSELLKLPDEIGPIVVGAVAIGFPVVLFFAWAYEMTPQGIKREREVDRSASITRQTGRKLDRAIIAMLVVVAAYFIWESRFAERAPAEPETQTTGPAEPSPTGSAPAAEESRINPKSVAVLPFNNRSRLEEDEFFVEGIHDDLLTNLARIGDLKVISRTSMLRFKDTEKPIPEIAEELGVATVMEGAVQRSGNTVRINVQLIDAATDEHLWAEIFDRELTADNLFAIQSEISEQIAAALKATLSPEEQQRISKRPTENLAAYNAYLRGRQLMSRRNSSDLFLALTEFERAVELDPEFALGWVGVAETTNLLPGYSNADPLDMVKRQEQAASRALELNDGLGEAHLSMAEVHEFYERLNEAEAAYLRAIELSPNYATAYHWYADFIARWPRRATESLELTRKAVELDPLSSILQMEIAEKLNYLGRFQEAEQQLLELIENDPDFAPANSMMASIKANMGRFDEQVTWLKKSVAMDPGRIMLRMAEAMALLNLGDEASFTETRQATEAIDPDHFVNGWLDVVGNLYQGNHAGALEAVRWVDSKLGRQPSFQITFGFVHILAGNYENARTAFEIGEPRFFDRNHWEAALEQQNGLGCIFAWVMARTGDEALGRDLLEATIDYLENDLPRYLEHPDRFGYTDCYLIRGDLENGIAAFEQQVADGHYGEWWIFTSLPWYEALRGTERFEAAMRTIRENNSAQQENLRRMEAGAGA